MIAVFGDAYTGGTFLSWSLHFLAGHKTHYHAKTNSWIPLVDNPIVKQNAHGFLVNRPLTLNETTQMLEKINTQPTELFSSMYVHGFGNSDSISAIKQTQQSANKCIVLGMQPRDLCLYQSKYNSRGDFKRSLSNQDKILYTADEIYINFVDAFFFDSKQKWNDLNLTEVWDQREFLALNLRPFELSNSILNLVDRTAQHYYIDALDLYYNFTHRLTHLFDFLNIKLNNKNLEHWQKIYSHWQQLHTSQLQFIWYFDSIIDSIINGYYLDLSRFGLDIIQESVIQHTLIYKHGLNFKTWHLEKFIDTKQLHSLLEPNLHPLN